MRLLIHLAVQPDEASTIQEIAERYGISRNHLVKIAHRAVQAGWVEGTRGRGGGLKLARKAKEIGIGQVLRATEDWRTVECFDPVSNRCPIAGGCGLQPILKDALTAYFAVLDRYSLADVVRRKSFLIQLLGLRTAKGPVQRRKLHVVQ
jgi:Rrf2 family transcriptional regulator, nitric oxide-sensitive transcriptional repressor